MREELLAQKPKNQVIRIRGGTVVLFDWDRIEMHKTGTRQIRINATDRSIMNGLK